MKLKIRHRWNGEVLFSGEFDSLKLCVEAAVKWADLTYADLAYADLTDADLTYADLTRASLMYANLTRAKWSSTKWASGIVISKPPIQIYGFDYPITILDAHMQIGCELRRLSEWDAFDDKQILDMGGKRGLTFWRAHKNGLLSIARGAGRGPIDG